MNDTTILHAKKLTKRFNNFTAVDSIDLDIARGEIFGFLGLNGAGKTTTIRMLLGMIRPSAGDIHLFGEKVSAGDSHLWRRVGYLVETPYAYPELTVRENLAIVAKLRALKDRHAVEKIMERLQLTQYANRPARHLSLGNAQRLGLAKALIHNPDLLILDEPTNGLDPAGIVEIRTLLHSLAKDQGVTIFTSSHLLDEMARLITSMGIVHRGKLLQKIDTEAFARLTTKRLHIQTTDNARAKAELTKRGYQVRSATAGLYVLDAKAVEHPDAISVELVKVAAPPLMVHVESESLEEYFLREIGKETNKGDH
jgi:ABC-2 type transport system ATP-binding protein